MSSTLAIFRSLNRSIINIMVVTGVAGFGTPGAICSSLLVSLG